MPRTPRACTRATLQLTTDRRPSVDRMTRCRSSASACKQDSFHGNVGNGPTRRHHGDRLQAQRAGPDPHERSAGDERTSWRHAGSANKPRLVPRARPRCSALSRFAAELPLNPNQFRRSVIRASRRARRDSCHAPDSPSEGGVHCSTACYGPIRLTDNRCPLCRGTAFTRQDVGPVAAFKASIT